MQQLSKQANNKTEKQNKQPSKKATNNASKQGANKLSKLPNTARSAALAVLGEVLAEGAYTNIAINKYLRTHQLESMERRLFTELVYGTVKALGIIDWYLAAKNVPITMM